MLPAAIGKRIRLISTDFNNNTNLKSGDEGTIVAEMTNKQGGMLARRGKKEDRVMISVRRDRGYILALFADKDRYKILD